MFSKLVALTGLNGLILKLIGGAVLLIALGFWINWSLDTHALTKTQADTIGDLNAEITKLKDSIDDYTDVKKKIKLNFDDIEQSQINLLCSARYDAPAPVIPETTPQIVEVVKYRDRYSQCPTSDPAKAEVFDPAKSTLRPVNDEIAAQVINNSWRAYCTATNNEDEVCVPFR
jgi:hypothetical protein